MCILMMFSRHGILQRFYPSSKILLTYESRKIPRTKFFDIEKPFSGILLCFLVVFSKAHGYQSNCYMSICYYTGSEGRNLANTFLQHLEQQCYTSTPFFPNWIAIKMINSSVYTISMLSLILFSFTFVWNVRVIKSTDEIFSNIIRESVLNSSVFKESAVFKEGVLSKETSQKKTNLLYRRANGDKGCYSFKASEEKSEITLRCFFFFFVNRGNI